MTAKRHNGIPCWGPDQGERERVGKLERYVEPKPRKRLGPTISFSTQTPVEMTVFRLELLDWQPVRSVATEREAISAESASPRQSPPVVEQEPTDADLLADAGCIPREYIEWLGALVDEPGEDLRLIVCAKDGSIAEDVDVSCFDAAEIDVAAECRAYVEGFNRISAGSGMAINPEYPFNLVRETVDTAPIKVGDTVHIEDDDWCCGGAECVVVGLVGMEALIQEIGRSAVTRMVPLSELTLRERKPPSAAPAEDLRLPRVDGYSGLIIKGVKLNGDLMPLDECLWADERAGEVCFALLLDGSIYSMTETRVGHVEIIGPTDDERRAHLARHRVPPD